MEKVAIVNAKEMWQEFHKMKDALKEEIIYEMQDRKELAKYLKVTEQTIINWSSRGITKPIFIEGRVYYKAKDIEELLNK